MGTEQDADKVGGMASAPVWQVCLMAQQAALHGRLREVMSADDAESP